MLSRDVALDKTLALMVSLTTRIQTKGVWMLPGRLVASAKATISLTR